MRTLLSFLFFTVFQNIYAQLTINKPVFLRSQSEIIEFKTNYPNVETINGYLRIGIDGSDIIDLSGLESIKEIKGDLIITKNSKLETIEPLNNICEISGDLRIEYNSNLQILGDFKELRQIDGNFGLLKNGQVRNLKGFSNLDKVNGSLFIAENNSIVNLQGLESIKEVNGYINIRFNEKLESIEQLQIVNGIKSKNRTIADVIIYGNKQLTNCNCVSVINILIDENRYTDIDKNSVGCNSRKEIIENYVIDFPGEVVSNILNNKPKLITDFVLIEMNFNGILILKDEKFNEIERFKAVKGSNKIPISTKIKGIFSIWDENGTMKYIEKK